MKQRYFALFLAVLMTCLLPAGALAAGFSSDVFAKAFAGGAIYCGDSNCMAIGCKGAEDPKHGTSAEAEFATKDLNLSSVGKNMVLDFPVKPGLAINGIPWLPDYGHKGHSLMNKKDLEAAHMGAWIANGVVGLNVDDMVIARDRLYIEEGALRNIFPRWGGESFSFSDLPTSQFGSYFNMFDSVDPAIASAFKDKEFIKYNTVEEQLQEIFPGLNKNVADIKGVPFELALNGKPRANFWGGNVIPYQHAAHELGLNATLNPAQVAEGFEGLANSGLSNGFINTSEAGALREAISKLKNGSSNTISVQDFNTMNAMFWNLQDLGSKIGFQVPFFDPDHANAPPNEEQGCSTPGSYLVDGNCMCDGAPGPCR